MIITGRREVLHVGAITDGDKRALTSQGFTYFEDDIHGNQMWEREDNFFVDNWQAKTPHIADEEKPNGGTREWIKDSEPT